MELPRKPRPPVTRAFFMKELYPIISRADKWNRAPAEAGKGENRGYIEDMLVNGAIANPILNVPTIEARLAAHRPIARDHTSTQHAAVAVTLRDSREGPEVLLIRRAANPRDPWSGHMAFPGGRREPHDLDLRHTAERETLEELGLPLERVGRLAGQLDDVDAVAGGRNIGLVVRPHVYSLSEAPELRPNKAEVAEAIWAPLAPMMEGKLDTVRPYTFGGREVELPAYDLDGRLVWGLTYHMLQTLFSVCRF